MEWYNILSIILGALGGTAGLVSIYHAKSNKQTIDISNMSSMLDEAHAMFEEMKNERDGVTREFQEYKNETLTRFAKVEKRLDNAEEDVLNLKRSIYQGYRCKYPQHISDCPVIKEYEKIKCAECDRKDTTDCVNVE